MVRGMRGLATPWLLVTLGGCWLSGGEIADVIDGVDADTDADADADTDADADGDVEVVVSPGQGITGDVLTLTGGPFANDAEVRVGGASADVSDVASGEITAVVPTGDEGFYDVTVESSDGNGVARDAFFRWDDATGFASVVGEVAWYDYVGSYWYPSPPADSGTAVLHFLRSSSMTAVDLYGPDGVSGDCVLDYQPSLDVTSYPAFGESLALTTATGRRMDFDFADGQWENPDFGASVWTNGLWRLEAAGTPGTWPDLDVAGFVRTPDPFSVSQPAINGSNAPDILFGLQQFTWSTTGAGDFVIIDMTRYAGDTFAERLTCIVPDTGSYQTPLFPWSDWNSYDQITILVGRVIVTDVTLPSGGTVEVAGVRYVVGAGYQL